MSKGALGLLAAYWPEDTPRYAHIPLKTVTEIAIHAIAGGAAARPAFVHAGGTLSYGELSARVRAMADALRERCQRGARVGVALDDPGQLLVTTFGAFEAELLVFPSLGTPAERALRAFAPELIVGAGGLPDVPAVSFEQLSQSSGTPRSGRPDFRTPILAFAKPDRSGEVLHNHRSLVATAIAVGGFYMLGEDSQVVLLEPPTAWHTLALLLGAWNKGATVWAGWGAAASLPERADYVVCDWDTANRFLEPSEAAKLPSRIAAGAIVAIEKSFSLSRRRRLTRAFGTPVLTLFGRSDLGPVIGSHPTWFLDDAAGIPLPNVDTRPLNPMDKMPLSIGWDAVEQGDIGVRSALAPAGGTLSEGWLQTGIIAEVDPTGLYFLRADSPLRAVR